MIPVLCLHKESGRLWLGGGASLTTHECHPRSPHLLESASIAACENGHRAGSARQTWFGRGRFDDITGMAALPACEDVIIAHGSGLLHRCRVTRNDYGKIEVRSLSRFSHPKALPQAVAACNAPMFACATVISGTGSIAIYRSKSPWIEPVRWRINTRPWSMALDTSSTSLRWLAVGHMGEMPLSMYDLDADGLPVDVEYPVNLLGNERHSAVYGITQPAPNGPFGSAANTIVSGWYDGAVRAYDLRRASKQPTVTLKDPFSDAPVYCLAAGGGSGCTIASGTSQHGLVRLWDIRKASDPTAGISLFGPGRDRSPVYDIAMEHDRIYAATDRRAWVIQFGEGREQQQIRWGSGRDLSAGRSASPLAYYPHSKMALKYTD